LFSARSQTTVPLSAACRACSETGSARARRPRGRSRPAQHAIDGVPELSRRVREILALLRGPARHGNFFFPLQGVRKIGPNPVELCRPGRERIPPAGVHHVAHRQAETVQIVLQAQQLERVLAVAIVRSAAGPQALICRVVDRAAVATAVQVMRPIKSGG
jgi:hypothetical protein